MPFTLAHPAAALPLRGRLGRLGSTPALAVGAVIPDLPYFLPLGLSGAQSHSVAGLLWFCLPAGLVAWAAYRVVVRPFAVVLAPAAIAARFGLGGPLAWSWAGLRGAAVSVVVGASTHVAWDSFTHSTGSAVLAVAALRRPVHLFPGYTPFAFTLLQHGSTLLGLGILGYWGILWFRRTKPAQNGDARRLPTWARLAVMVALGVPSAVAGGLVLWAPLSSGEPPFPVLQNNLGRAVFSAGTVFLTVFMATALAWRVWDARFGGREAAQRRDAPDEAQGGTRTAS